MNLGVDESAFGNCHVSAFSWAIWRRSDCLKTRFESASKYRVTLAFTVSRRFIWASHRGDGGGEGPAYGGATYAAKTSSLPKSTGEQVYIPALPVDLGRLDVFAAYVNKY